MEDQNLKPFDGVLDAPSSGTLQPFSGALDGEEPKRGLKGWGQDIAATAVKGAIAIPEAAVGLADILTGGRVGKFLENEGGAVGFRPKQTREIVNDWHSDATKEAQRKFQEADGIVDKAVTAVQNPSLVVASVGESIPTMIGGGAIGRGLLAATRLGQMGAKGAALAGAAGEGLTMAGSQAEQIRQETPDGLLTPSQAGLAAATGAVGGAVGAVGGRIAQRLGIGDAETMLAQGRSGMARQFADEAAGAAVNPLQQQAVKSIPRHVIEGAIAEGLLEELPQSVAEQIFQNVALDKPWYDQVDSAIVLGALSGGAMGAGAAGYHAAARPRAAAVGEGDPAAARPAGDEPAAEAPARNPGLERVSEAFAEQLRMLQEQEQGEVLGPQSAPPDGAAALAEQRAAAAAQRQADMEASRAVESPDDEIYQSTGAQVPRSVRMGINPADGPLSTGAAMAVDTGVSDQMQQAAALAQAAEAGEKSGKAQKQEQPARSPLGADPETGEIPGSDDVANWSDAQLSEVFRGAQGRDVRIKLAQELSRRKAARAAEQSTPVKGTTDGPQAQPASTQPPAAAQAPAVAAAGAPAQGTLINGGTTTADAGAQAKTAAGAQAAPESKDQRAQRIDAAGQTWTRLPTVQRQVVAEQLKGLKPVLQKNLAGAKWENLNSDLKRKIADLIAPVQEAAAAPAPAPAAPVAMARGTTFPPLDAQPVPAAAEARVPPKAAGTSARAARAAAAPVSAPTVAQAAAQEAATSLSNDLPEPTEAQKLAGNYRKGHARINGHDISIENPAGTRRRPEWPPLQNHYGYIKGTKGADKDHVDVFMTDRAEDSALPVFVVDQVNKDGSFDEHKVVMGAADEAEARSTYLGNYEKGWTGLGGITQMTQDEFKDWVRDPAKTVKPAAAPAAGDALPTAAAEEAGPAPDKDAETAPAPAPALPASESASAAPPAPPAAAETVPQRMKRAKAEKAAAPATPAAAGEASPAAKPKTVPEKMKDAKAKRESKAVREAREAEERRAAYFAPGNVVRGYGGGFDRVVSYQPADADGRWSVTVREVQKDGSGAWADKAGAVERTHGTEPSKVNYATGPAGRMEVDPAPAPAAASHEPSAPARNRDNARKRGPAESEPLFRRYAQDDLGAGMAAELLRIMGKGDGFSPEARLQAVESIRATVSPIVAAWQNAPEVVVAYDLNDPIIPQRVRDADTRQRSGGAHGAPEGFYFGGKAYLMASRLTTPEDAARVLYHEVAGHHGLRGLFGPELDKILNQVATMRRADVDAKMAEYGMRGVDRISRARAAEEVLAEMAEKNPQLSFVQRAVAAIRNFLREHVPGFGSLRLRDADIIQAYILPARNWVERAAAARERGMGSAAMQYSLAQDEARSGFAAEVRAAITAGLNNDERALRAQVPLGIETPAALEALGVVRKPVVTNRNLLAKMHFEHGVPRADLERLGELLSNPVMVFKSDTQPGRMVVVTSLVVRGNPVVVAVDPNGASNRAEVVYVPSAYPKDNADRTFTRWIRDGLLQFANKKESRQLATTARLQLPGVVQRVSGFRANYKTEADLPQTGAGPDVMFSRERIAALKDSALDQITQTMSHPGKVSLWDKTIGTMRHLAERAPAFKPVFESAQRFIDDVSMLGNDAADMAPRLLPRVDSWRDLTKKPITAADNKAVARPLFEGTLMWARDIDGTPVLLDDLTAKYQNLPADQKAQLLLRGGRLDPKILTAWQGLPVGMYEANVNTSFNSRVLKAGVVWSQKELETMFGLDANQVSLYQEGRAAIDRSIDMTARADMLRSLGDEYAGMRDAVLAQETLDDAVELLTRTLMDDARDRPEWSERLMKLNNAVVKAQERAQQLMDEGYAPLSRFGRYTVDVVDAAGDRQYFGMFETKADSNRMKAEMEKQFPGATVTQGTMSQDAFKLFAGVTPESLEMFGSMLGLDGKGDDPKDKAFQAYLQLAKNNHSALKRLIHRKGVAGYSEDVGRVLASFVYSNARLGAGGLNAGTMESAINAIPKEQGELKDLAMGLRDYIANPQEEGQAVRGMLFAQYLGGSVASAAVNMMQPFQITMPWLSQFGGMRKAGAQMARALKDMSRKGFQYEPDLAAAMQSAEEDGVVSPQEIHQLMSQARGTGSLRTGDGTKVGDARAAVANNWERVKVAWGQPFALAEQFNRRSTFIAAYRMAKEQGMAEPSNFARKAVLETQFVYSKANKPRFARGAVGGALFCVDDTTEALTQRGWVGPDHLVPGDMLASFDMTTERLIWAPMASVHIFDHDGEMVHAKSKTLDMLMTPDHRVVHYKRKRTKGAQRGTTHWELGVAEAQDIPASHRVQIPTAAPFDHLPTGEPITDAQARVLGWVVTEGWFTKKNRGREEWGGALKLYQNEGRTADLIRADLDAAGLEYTETTWNYVGGNAAHIRFNIKKSSAAVLRKMLPGKQLTPALLMRMTKAQIELLVDRMIEGDGSESAAGQRCLIQNPGQTLETFQMALTILGKSFRVSKHGPSCRKVLIRESQRTENGRYSVKESERVRYTGRVWCPIVPGTSTWVARRNGMPFITHNTFKTYSVSYLELMHRMWTQGGPEGKRAVGWAIAMLLLMSGAGGLPFMEDAEDLIDGAAQMMGYNLSSKQWRKQLLADVMGKEIADFVEQGVSGLPGAPVDVSGRMGLGNLLPGTGLLLSKQNRERDLLEVAGPAGDLIARGFTAGRKLLTGDAGGAALEVAPTAVRNAVKGVDMAATGIYKDKKGYKVIDTTLAEAGAKFLGFQPKSVAEVQEANSFMQRTKTFYTQTSSEIKAQWADALFRKDDAALAEARERLADWNRNNPEQPIVVKMPDVWKRVREMGKDRTQRIADTAPKALRQQMREAAREAGQAPA